MEAKRVFLSYHSVETGMAKTLAEAIHTRDPRVHVFFAPWALQAGAFWIPSLARSIDEADAFILLIGKRGLGSWQLLEYYQAMDRKANETSFPVIPVLLGNTALRIPFLKQVHWLKLAVPLTPEDMARLLSAIRGTQFPVVDEPWRSLNPYRGLEAMTDADADFFFGREKLTIEIIERLREGQRFLVLVGNSGVGKSSLIHAGVLATLRRQRWPGCTSRGWPSDLRDSRAWLFLNVRPENQPLRQLVHAFVSQWIPPTDPECANLTQRWEKELRRGLGLSDLIRATTDHLEHQRGALPPRLVIVVDQGEELLTRTDRETARHFATLLAAGHTCPNLITISSLRSNYYGWLQQHEDVFQIASNVDVPPLRAPELQEVVTRPARMLSVSFADESVAQGIATSTARQPGALPLLSYLLQDMWKDMQQVGDGVLRPVPLDVRGVLARRAEEYLENCSREKQDTIKRLFTLHLAYVPVHGEVTRRPALQHECFESEWRIVQELAGPMWRLLVTGERHGESTVEVAHDVLLQDWPRLGTWLGEKRAFLRWKGQLEQAWDTWVESGRDQNALLRGWSLERALEQLEEHASDLNSTQREFIRQSEALRDKERAELEAIRQSELDALRQQERLQRVKRRLYQILFGFFATATAVGGIVLILILALHTSLKEEHAAALRHQSRYLAHQSRQQTEKEHNATLGLLLALEALPTNLAAPNHRPYVPEAETALYRAMAAPRERFILTGHGARVIHAAFSPDGRRLVTVADEKQARLWSTVTGEAIAILAGHEDKITYATMSPNGERIVTASWDGTARLWNTTAAGNDTKTVLAPLMVLKGHTDCVFHAAFSPNGEYLVTASRDGTARLWDAHTGELLTTLAGHKEGVFYAGFSPTERHRVITAAWDKTARFWNAITGETISVLEGHQGHIEHISFSPDGRRVVTASEDGTARIWDVATGHTLLVLKGHTDRVHHAVFSPNGQRIVTSSIDGTARVWDAATGDIVHILKGHRRAVFRADFDERGNRIATASEDKTARLWDARSGKLLAVLTGHTARIQDIKFSPSENQALVTTSADKTVRLWNIGGRDRALVLDGHQDDVFHVAFGPDNRRLLSASGDHTARLWDAHTGQQLAVLRGHSDVVVHASFSPKRGTRIITASADNTARLWDSRTAALLHVLRGHKGPVWHTAFSLDGKRVITASEDKTARVWDVKTGALLVVLRGHSDSVWDVAISPNGQLFATASRDKTARLWDAHTGEIVTVLKGHQGDVVRISFTADGKYVLTASVDGTAKLWRTKTGVLVHTLKDHTRAILHATIDRSGKYVATASADGTVRLWNVRNGNLLHILRGHRDPVRHVDFSSDGRRIATASSDQTVGLWQVGSRDRLASLEGHIGKVWHVTFSPDNNLVASASQDHTIRIWHLWPTGQELIDLAHHAAARELTLEEQRFFLGRNSHGGESNSSLSHPLSKVFEWIQGKFPMAR